MNIEEKLKNLGYELPAPSRAAANYIPYTSYGDLLFISGQIPFINGQAVHIGQIGRNLTIEQGIESAVACALNILAQAYDAVAGDWSRIRRCLKLGGFVSCGQDFTDHPKVINGASDLIVNLMGDAGRHTRFAVGASSLPLGVPVEIEALFEIKN